MEYLTVAFCVATCLLIYAIFNITIWLVRRRHLYKQISKFEGPPTLPLIGNAHLFIGSAETILNRAFKLMKSYDSPFLMWIGHRLAFGVTTPEQLKEVLQSDKTIDKAEVSVFLLPFLGHGLLTAPPEKWRVQRQHIQPSFHLKNIQSFVEVFSAQSAIAADKMERHLNGPEFDIHDYASMYPMNTTCETVMGVNLRKQSGGKRFQETLPKVMATIVQRGASPWLYPDFIFNRTQLGKDQQKNIKYLQAFTDKIIQSKKKEFVERSSRPGMSDLEDDEYNPKRHRKSFLEHFVGIEHGGEKLSDKALQDEVATMVVGATDTSVQVISYAMLMLASHPEVQEKVYQELCEIYGEDDDMKRHVTREDLSRMKYLERVIKETMRLFPPAPFLVRSVDDDLDIGEVTLPKGSILFLGIIGIHRNEKYWSDPMKFNPDRFLPEEVAKRHPFAYLPFGGGIRNCIGYKYAMMSIKTFLATILRRYVLTKDDIQPVEDIRIKCEFLLRLVNPIYLRIHKRTPNAVSF